MQSGEEQRNSPLIDVVSRQTMCSANSLRVVHTAQLLTAGVFTRIMLHECSLSCLQYEMRRGFVACMYRVFLKILTHLFSVFEVLNVCRGSYSAHETKEGSLEICLTACMLSFVRSYNRTKENAKTLQFHFWAKSSILTQRRFRGRFRHETVSSRTTIICLTEIHQRMMC